MASVSVDLPAAKYSLTSLPEPFLTSARRPTAQPNVGIDSVSR